MENKWFKNKMVKSEFLILLKDISDNLTKNEIKFDIPYCHIDKKDFNHIYIIIPDFLVFDELDFLNLTFIKEKKGIIYTEKNGFPVNFVKTSEDLWGYTFHYYSWNTLNIYIQCLCEYFNMTFDRTGLKYNYNNKEIFLSKNLKTIIEFLGLSFRFYGLGFPTELVINTYIESSPYYNTKNFTHNNFKKYDTMYEYNMNYYNNFVKYKSECGSETKTEEEKILLIDTTFDVKFIEKLYKIQMEETLPKGVIKKSKEQVIDKELPKKPSKKKISIKNIFGKNDEPEYKLED